MTSQSNIGFNGNTLDNHRNGSYKAIELRNIVVPIVVSLMSERNKATEVEKKK